MRNVAYAKSEKLPHEFSYGTQPVLLYEPFSAGRRHGNFLDASYRAILEHQEWKCRLEKVHTHATKSLPKKDRVWKELDSCMSSDALLMNVFCDPGVPESSRLRSLLGIDPAGTPEFGFKARVPLLGGRTDRTEVDMKLGNLLVESKLTETDFQTKEERLVESYQDLPQTFDRQALPRVNGVYNSYQLIRNVLAAHDRGLDFCVLLDARRPDLREAWYRIMSCVMNPDLKTRCKILTWQELSEALPTKLQHFLDIKYGIVPSGVTPSSLGDPDH